MDDRVVDYLTSVDTADSSVTFGVRTQLQAEHLDFTECIKHGGPTYAPAEIGHRTTTVSHLGNIAMQLGRRLQWDPTHERFTNDAEANTMLSRKQREPWTIQNVDRWLNVG